MLSGYWRRKVDMLIENTDLIEHIRRLPEHVTAINTKYLDSTAMTRGGDAHCPIRLSVLIRHRIMDFKTLRRTELNEISVFQALISAISAARIASIDDYISAGCVGARVADKVDVSALELLRETVAAHRDHGHPEILDLLVNKVGETSVNVAGRDGVNPGKVTPLIGERPSHVYAAGLGDIVGGLFLWEVGWKRSLVLRRL